MAWVDGHVWFIRSPAEGHSAVTGLCYCKQSCCRQGWLRTCFCFRSPCGLLRLLRSNCVPSTAVPVPRGAARKRGPGTGVTGNTATARESTHTPQPKAREHVGGSSRAEAQDSEGRRPGGAEGTQA